MDKTEKICSFCNKEFSCKMSLVRHQKTAKNCLQIQGKEEINIQCSNCKKFFSIKYYKQHKEKCDLIFENTNKKQQDSEKESKNLNEENKKLKEKIYNYESEKKDYETIINDLKKENEKLKLELVEYKTTSILLREQNNKLQSISTSVTMKLADKASTINNKTVVINAPLTNEVLRQCASTFTLDNAYNINGITKHLTSSLEDHITCTDPSRNIFKYTNEKDEEIIDQDLEILIPQYLTAVKDRNNFLYKEVYDYFKKNNVSFNEQTDYQVFYQALNNIIEKTGQQNKYTEKYKQYMVRECKRRFLEKNKKKEKTITKKLSDEEIMMNIIETGGSLNDYVMKVFPEYYMNNEEETEEEFSHRRNMEDIFRQKKREWKEWKEKNNN
jgi:hypothetical protein